MSEKKYRVLFLNAKKNSGGARRILISVKEHTIVRSSKLSIKSSLHKSMLRIKSREVNKLYKSYIH